MKVAERDVVYRCGLLRTFLRRIGQRAQPLGLFEIAALLGVVGLFEQAITFVGGHAATCSITLTIPAATSAIPSASAWCSS